MAKIKEQEQDIRICQQSKLTAQLEYISEDLSENELNDEEDCVRLTQAEVMALHSYTESSEAALKILEEVCGISLQNN